MVRLLFFFLFFWFCWIFTGFPLFHHINRCVLVSVHSLLPMSMVAPQGGVRWPAVMALIGRSVLARPPPIRIKIVPRPQIAAYFRYFLFFFICFSLSFNFWFGVSQFQISTIEKPVLILSKFNSPPFPRQSIFLYYLLSSFSSLFFLFFFF